MSCFKQKGGGVFDVFCPLCNLPFYSPFEGQKPLTDDDEDDELYALRNTKLDWLSDVLGLDDNTSTVMELEGDDRYGQFPIKGGKKGLFGLRDSVVLIEGIKKKEEYDGIGAAFHNDCFKYISQKSGRPISYQLGIDIEQKIEDYFKAHPKVRRSDDYQQQSYDFQGALEANDPEYFVSPLEPDGKHVQQMLSDFIPKNKTPSPKKNKTPSPKKNKTPSPPRPVQAEAVQAESNVVVQMKKKGAASGATTATVDNSCSSQKDKVICIKKKCVWGKTNRCSKKRSTRKKTKSKSKPTANTHACPSHKDRNECVMNNCIWGKTNRCSKKRVSK